MHAQMKHQWIAALRSGNYVQGTGALRTLSDEYCANGVLCDLHRQAHPGTQGWEQLGSVRQAWFYEGSHCFPSLDVRSWAAIDTATLEILEGLNDARGAAGLSFEELALYIENTL